MPAHTTRSVPPPHLDVGLLIVALQEIQQLPLFEHPLSMGGRAPAKALPPAFEHVGSAAGSGGGQRRRGERHTSLTSSVWALRLVLRHELLVKRLRLQLSLRRGAGGRWQACVKPGLEFVGLLWVGIDQAKRTNFCVFGTRVRFGVGHPYVTLERKQP